MSKSEMKWIPVTERLPYSGEDVLVCVAWPKGQRTVDTSYVIDSGEWQMGSAKLWRITHWMPMPALP